MLNKIFQENKRKLLILLSIFLIATLAISMMENVNATDKTIGPNTPGGLKKAIETVKNGSTIYLENGAFNGTTNTQISINKKITIHGKGKNVIIDGKSNKYSPIFIVEKGAIVTLKNLKIINAYDIRGAILNSGKLKVRECMFINNSNRAILNSGKLKVIGCTFINNIAFGEENGGAIYNNYSDNVSIINSKFKNNHGDLGGAIYNKYSDNVSIINSKFKNNEDRLIDPDGIYGGAIYNDHGNHLNIIYSIFEENTAGGNGGAIYTYYGDFFNVSNSKFINNKGRSWYGGAIHICGGEKPSITNTAFISNYNKFGGAIFTEYHDMLFINNCSFINNTAGYGGAIEYKTDKVIISKSKFINNIASSQEGAIYRWETGMVELDSSTIFQNNSISTSDGIIQLHSSSEVKGKKIAINIKLSNFAHYKINKGHTFIQFKLPKNINKNKITKTMGTLRYNSKTKIYTWKINNTRISNKTSINLSLNAKDNRKYTLSKPSISSNNNIILNNKAISFRV